MKRLIALLLTLLLLAAMPHAMADGGGWRTAYVNGRDADRVHLRGVPSTDAPSLGLYFTGTEVSCLSDPAQEWVEVAIGTETGYMKGEYLSGSAVPSAQPIGVVNANNVHFREAPSTQSEAITDLHDGTALVIRGETVDNWYYAACGAWQGYIKADYVTLGAPAPVSPPSVSGGNVTVTFDLEDSVMAYIHANNCRVYVHATDDDFITCVYDPSLLTLEASTARGTNILFFDSASGTPVLADTAGAHVYLPRGRHHSVDLSVTGGVGYLSGAVDADLTVYGSQSEVVLLVPTDYTHRALVSLSRSSMSVSLSEGLANYAIRFDEVTGSVIDVSGLAGVPAHDPGADHYSYTAGTGDAQLLFDIVRDSTVDFSVIAAKFTDFP